MFCMKCGKPTEDGQTICPECAAAAQPVQEQPVQIPVEEQPAPAQEPVYEAPVQEPVYEAPMQEPMYQAPMQEPVYQAPMQEPAVPAEELFNLNFSSEMPENTKKSLPPQKKKLLTGIIAGVVALAIVAVGLLGFFAWGWGEWIQNLFWKLLPAEEYKEKVEEKALVNEEANNETALLKQGLVDVYGAFVNYAGPQDSSAEVNLNLDLGEELVSLLELAVGNQLPEGLEIPTNASLSLGSTAVGDSTQLDIGLGLNKVDLLKLRAIIDTAKKLGYMGILSPEGMSEEFFSVDITEAMEQMEDGYALVTLLQDLAAELPSQEAFSEMLDRYILLALAQIEEVEKETEKVEVDGVKQTFTVLTYEISEETLQDIAIAILEEAEDDETLFQIVQAFCNFANEMGALQVEAYSDDYWVSYEPAYYDPDEIFNKIPELIEQLKEEEVSDEKLFTIDTYVDGKANICGRKIEIEDADAEIFYITAVSGNKAGFLAEAEIEGQKVKLEGSGKVKKDQLTATLVLEAAKQEMLVVELENFHIKEHTGTIRIMLGDDAKELLEENMGEAAGIASILNVVDMSIELDIGADSIAVGLSIDDKQLITVSLSAATGDSPKISLPTKSQLVENSADMKEWLSKVDMGKLADQLGKAGLPAQLVDAVRELDLSEMIGSTAVQAPTEEYLEEDAFLF